MDLSRSNSQKKTLINANILISISLIIPYLLHSIPISIPKKKNTRLTLSLYVWSKPFVSPLVSLSLYFLNLRFSLSISSSIAPPLPPPQVAGRIRKKKIKNHIEHCWEEIHNWLWWVVGHFPPMPNKMFFCRSWVIISDFPLGSNGELGTTHSSPNEVSPLSLSFWPDEILGFSCSIK